MIIKAQSIELENFQSHQNLKVNFGEETEITGDNGKGKSTLLNTFPYLVYSTDALGSKMDPTPLTYASEQTLVQVLLEVDGKPLLLGKVLKKGKTSYYINEVPKKATEFNELISQMFDKDLFLSLMNPTYFFTLKWEQQRSMLLQYVSAPANKEVLKQLPDVQAEKLGTLLKKHNLLDIEKIHRENKTSLEKKHIAAQSRTKTLKGQLEVFTIMTPIDSLKVELAQIDKQVREKENLMDEAFEKNQAYNKCQSELRNIQDQIDISKERWPSLKNEVIEDTCKTCQRPLDEESVEAVKADKGKRIDEYKAKHNELLKKREELKAQLQTLEFIDVSELREEIRKIDSSGIELREAIRAYAEFERLQVQVNEAQVEENRVLESLNDSIFVIDTVKAFKAKEAQIQAEKVQALFETLSIKLFEELKNGELKNTFEIEMDGKPYRKLSLSEGIRAGLELREVLIKQSGVNVPVFIDNAESITSFKKPTGQVITSRVVAGKDLTIEVIK